LRILILIGLFYLLFRLLINSGKRERTVESGPGLDPGGPAQDILKEDPVCHTLIPARRAITWQDNGKYLYFCSENCRSKYLTSQGDQT
jgi:YHS domain-containing protein